MIFVGIQGSGKTTFYGERFVDTHVRISLDLLRTRRREGLLLEACLAGQQPFVVDNTNASAAERARYVEPARAAGFRVVAYEFRTPLALCLARNAARPDRSRVPPQGIFGTRKRLEPPDLTEGFDAIYIVDTAPNGTVTVTPAALRPTPDPG